MAFPNEPDNELEYVPSIEDETAGNPELPVAPQDIPDNDPTLSDGEVDNGSAIPVESEVPYESDNTQDPDYTGEGAVASESVYAGVFGLPLENPSQDTDEDAGEAYSASAGAPLDDEWDALPSVVPPAPTLSGLDYWETIGTEDFDTSDQFGQAVGEDDYVPVSYEIQGRQSGGSWNTLAVVSATEVTTEIQGLPSGEGWTFRIRAVFVTGETGDWSAETAVDLPNDLAAPGTPSAPTVVAGRGIVTIRWDGLDTDAKGVPADYKHTTVWASETGDLGTFNAIGLIFGAGEMPWTNAKYNVGYRYALSSLDLSGNESSRSATAVATLKPLVEEPDIQAELDRIDEETGGLITEAGELNDRLAQAETDLVTHDGVIKDLNEVKLPALQGDLDASEATVNTLKNTTIPALNTRLGTAESELSTTKTQLNNRLSTAETGLTNAQGLIDQLEDDVVLAAKTAAIEDLYVTGVGTIKEAVIDKLWADVIRARKITTDQLLVGGSGDNLISDPLFTNTALTARRQEVANSIYDAGWYWAGSYWYSRANPADGEYRMWFPNNLEPAGVSSYDQPVTPGITYRFQIDAFTTGAGSASLRATIRTKNQGGGSSYSFIPNTYAATSGWGTFSWDWTPDPDQAFAMPELVFSNVKDVARLALRNPSFKPKVDGSLIVNGSITGNHLEVNTVSAAVANVIKLNASAINAGTINTARLSATEIAAATASFQKVDVANLTSSTATISSAVIDKLWADVIHAKKITADMLVIGAGNNLIPNARLTSTDGWSGWGRNSSNGPGGQASIWGQGRKNLYSSSFDLEAGKRYRFEVQAMAQKAGSRIYVQVLIDGAAANPYVVNNATLSTSWQSFSGEFETPTGAISGRVNVYLNHPNGTSTDGYQWFTGWGLFPMVAGELLVNGTVTAAHIKGKTITAAEIATNAITADKIDGGAIDGKLITGATIRTSSSSTRLQMDSTGIKSLVGGSERLSIAASDGAIRATNAGGGQVRLSAFASDSGDGGTLTFEDTSVPAASRGTLELYNAGDGNQGWMAHKRGGTIKTAILTEDTLAAFGTITGNTFKNFVAADASYVRMRNDDTSGALASSSLVQLGTFVDMQSKRHTNGTQGAYQIDQLGHYFMTRPGGGGEEIQMSVSSDNFKALPVYKTTAPYPANVYIDQYGWMKRATSASRYKLDAHSIDEAVFDKLLNVEVKDWFDKSEAELLSEAMTPMAIDDSTPDELATEHEGVLPPTQLRRVPGVIAEEVEAVGLGQFVNYDDDGEVQGVMYDRLGVALIPVVRRQRDQLVAQSDRIDELEAKLEALTAKVDALLTA